MINLTIQTQPDDETCGPTCLYALYQHYNINISFDAVVQQVERVRSGGTLGPLLGKHALHQNFNATLYVNNLNVFDPTWFKEIEPSSDMLISKLNAQLHYKKDKALVEASTAYREYLELGGKIRFRTLNPALLKSYFNQGIPILTSLSATYLYRCAREFFSNDGLSSYDDIKGTPCGHFVVLCGYDDQKRRVVVADPHRENPISHNNYYKVSSNRLINAIMLGVLTYDANLLIIQPKGT